MYYTVLPFKENSFVGALCKEFNLSSRNTSKNSEEYLCLYFKLKWLKNLHFASFEVCVTAAKVCAECVAEFVLNTSFALQPFGDAH